MKMKNKLYKMVITDIVKYDNDTIKCTVERKPVDFMEQSNNWLKIDSEYSKYLLNLMLIDTIKNTSIISKSINNKKFALKSYK